jgi:hypothetical protein
MLRVFHLRSFVSVVLATLLAGCFGEDVPDGRILMKNDSRDREYNVIVVSAGGATRSLKPNEKFLLPAGTRSFSVSRQYKEYTRRYSVSCPAFSGAGIVVKTIDIHLNRIQGGCKTTWASHR